MAVTRIRYPSEYELANFLGMFEGFMMIIALFINVFLFSWIVKRQGMDIALSLAPVLIGLFMVVVIILGFAGDILPGTPGFLFFFLIMAFSRVISRSLDIAVEKPSLEILCRPLGEKQGPFVLTLFNGMGNEVAVVAAGLLLTVTGALAFVKLIHFSWLLVLIAAFWVYAALRLYREYRKFIRTRIAESEMKQKAYTLKREKEMFDSPGSAGLFIDNNYFELISASEIHENIIDNRLVVEQVINKAEKNLNPDLLPLLRYLKSGRYNSNGMGERLQSVLKDIEAGLEKEGLGRTKELVSTIEDSTNKKMHLRAIMAQQAAPVVTDLMRLIRDEDSDIRREALYIAGKFRIEELLPEICECLDNKYIAVDAYSVLRSFGEHAFTPLSRHFARSSGNIMTRRLIVRLFAGTGGRQALDFLLPRLWSVHRLMRKEVVRGLQKCGWKAGAGDRDRLQREVLDIIGLLTWNMAASLVLKENNDKLLYEAIEKESEWWKDFLFDILSLLYDKEALEEIRDKLDEGNVQSVNYAFEMIDIIIDENIKPQLKALLDPEPARYRFRKLKRFFPVRIPDYGSLITELVNKDYNHIGVWAKALAIRKLYKLPRPEETDFLVALLFGVHRILREESCRYLQENYDDVYSKCSYRLPKLYRDQLDDILQMQLVEDELVYRKLRSLSLLFPGIPENILSSLAENMKQVDEYHALSLDPASEFILWPMEYESDEMQGEIHMNWHTAGRMFDPARIEGKGGIYHLVYMSEIERFVFNEPDYSFLMTGYLDSILSDVEHENR
jgi:HEAT repeat protein